MLYDTHLVDLVDAAGWRSPAVTCVCLQSGSGAVVGAVRRDTEEMDIRGTLFRTVSWGQTAVA